MVVDDHEFITVAQLRDQPGEQPRERLGLVACGDHDGDRWSMGSVDVGGEAAKLGEWSEVPQQQPSKGPAHGEQCEIHGPTLAVLQRLDQRWLADCQTILRNVAETPLTCPPETWLCSNPGQHFGARDETRGFMMSITPTITIPSASPRPYAGVSGTWASTLTVCSFQVASLADTWVCSDHMSTEHNPTTGNTTGSKRLSPGSFAGVLT